MSLTTYKMLQGLVKEIPVPDFLTGWFQAPQDNYHNQSKILIDKEGPTEVVAVPVDGVGSDYNENTSIARNMIEVTPPVYKEKEALGLGDLMDRGFGVNPFEDANFQRNAQMLTTKITKKLVNKIQRATELQASQILTTGQLNLVDATAGTRYALDYNIDPSLINIAASVPWSTTATADPISDIMTAGTALRAGGKDVIALVTDAESYEAAARVQNWIDRFTAAGLNIGRLNPHTNPGTVKGSFRGVLHAGDFAIDVYTYGGQYTNALGAAARYVPRATCILLTEGRRDATFGGIPRFTDEKALSWLPNRISVPGKIMDINLNTWLSENREVLNIGVSARPLLIPTDKWSFASLNTRLA